MGNILESMFGNEPEISEIDYKNKQIGENIKFILFEEPEIERLSEYTYDVDLDLCHCKKKDLSNDQYDFKIIQYDYIDDYLTNYQNDKYNKKSVSLQPSKRSQMDTFGNTFDEYFNQFEATNDNYVSGGCGDNYLHMSMGGGVNGDKRELSDLSEFETIRSYVKHQLNDNSNNYNHPKSSVFKSLNGGGSIMNLNKSYDNDTNNIDTDRTSQNNL